LAVNRKFFVSCACLLDEITPILAHKTYFREHRKDNQNPNHLKIKNKIIGIVFYLLNVPFSILFTKKALSPIINDALSFIS